MDAISEMELFTVIADCGGIAAAARQLSSSAPAVSRRLARLEGRLGVSLVERSTRRFRVTEEGRLFLSNCRRIIQEVKQVEAEVAARGGAVSGLLKVGAPIDIGTRLISDLVDRFLRDHDKLQVRLIVSDIGLEPRQDDLDIAIRVGMPNDDTLIARRLTTSRRVVCGAPSYFEGRDRPRHPDDLARHECLVLVRRHYLMNRWRFRLDGEAREIAVSGRLSSGSGEVLRSWAEAGRGLSKEALWDVKHHLRDGSLVECLEDYQFDPIDLVAVFLPTQPVPPKIRVFIDFLVGAFAQYDA